MSKKLSSNDLALILSKMTKRDYIKAKWKLGLHKDTPKAEIVKAIANKVKQ